MARPPSNILSARNRQRLLDSLQARASAGDVHAAAELIRLSLAHEKLTVVDHRIVNWPDDNTGAAIAPAIDLAVGA